jgi:hypothetical protein
MQNVPSKASPGTQFVCPKCYRTSDLSHSSHICGVCGNVRKEPDPKTGKDGIPAPQVCPNPNGNCTAGPTLWPAISFTCAVCEAVTFFK